MQLNMTVYHLDAHWAFRSWSHFTKKSQHFKTQKGDAVQTDYKPSARCCRGRGHTVDPDLNQPPHQIHACPCLRREGGVRQWSGNLFKHRLLCATREYWDVAGGRRAVEDDCYLERGIRVVWAHHSGHVYLPAWTAQPRGGGRNERVIYLILYFKGGSSVMVKMKKWEGHWTRRQGRDSEMHTDGCWQISSFVKDIWSSWAQF